MALTTDSAGRVLGQRYRLLATIGTGASANVYLAEDLRLKREVAVKVLHPALVRDPAFLARFRAEARAAGSLNHPHVVRIFDWGEDEHGPYLVLEYLSGGSLRHLLDEGARLTPAQAARVGSEAARGLAYAHARGVVHRDVKPANLLFDDEGRVHLSDFGVARALVEATWTEPAGGMVGTIRYAAPEQAQGVPVDGRADVYALALVLYEAVTGSVPFAADTTVATLAARVGRRLPDHPALDLLGEVLAWAANADVAQRPGALLLAGRLDAVAASLPPPPPILAGAVAATAGEAPSGLPAGVATAAGEPPTGLPTAVIPRSQPAGAASTAVLPAAGPATPTGRVPVGIGPVSDSSPGSETTGGNAGDGTTGAGRQDRDRRRGRAWPWAVGLLGLAMLLAAGALFAVREKLFTPSHPVPSVLGLSVASARNAVRADHFGVVVSKQRYSTSVGRGRVIEQRPAPAASLKEGNAIDLVVSKGLPPEAVPSLLDLDCTAAQRLLTVVNLFGTCPPELEQYSTTVPGGQVITWIFAGRNQPATVPWHRTVTIVISKGPPPVTVPPLVGRSYASAQATLQAMGLSPAEVSQPSQTVPAGQVISTNPAAGQQVARGSSVTVVVSQGLPKVAVPGGLLGETLSQAEAVLGAFGLSVGSVSGPHSGVVASVRPVSGQAVAQGTKVSITMVPWRGSSTGSGAGHGRSAAS